MERTIDLEPRKKARLAKGCLAQSPSLGVLLLLRVDSVTQLFIATHLPGSSCCDKIKSKFLTDDSYQEWGQGSPFQRLTR